MKLMAILSAAVLALSLGTGARAEQYNDAEANFQLTVPDGWKSAKITNEYVKLMIAKQVDAGHFGFCMVLTQKHPETAQLSQAEIDAQMGPLVDEKFWQLILTMTPGTEEATLKSSTTQVRHGRNVYLAVMLFKLKDKKSEKTMDAMSKQFMLVVPGQFYFITCLTQESAFAEMESDFDTVFNSFGPISDTPVAQLDVRGVSALTLYSGAKFGGVSRVVTQDTPDLTTYGWRQATGSVSVSGAAPWEACSGANYTGNCQVVTGAFASGLSNGGAILSARRVQSRGRAALAKSLQSDAARALGAAVQRAQ